MGCAGMIGRYEYPCIIEALSDGGFLTRFPDIPEAINGAEQPSQLDVRATEALITALNFCMESGEALPVPSLAEENQALIQVPPLAAAKLALYETMVESKVTRSVLARRLGRDEAFVDRLLNLHLRCHIEYIDHALAVLGRRVVVTVQPMT
jgi:antitoxin HicB